MSLGLDVTPSPDFTAGTYAHRKNKGRQPLVLQPPLNFDKCYSDAILFGLMEDMLGDLGGDLHPICVKVEREVAVWVWL